MIKNKSRKFISRRRNESVEDPHELILSLVDMGSIDADEALLACVTEMSDAECKRVLGSLSLPECCDEVEDEEPSVEVDDLEDDADDLPVDTDELEDVKEDEEDDLDDVAELESRIRRLERRARAEESMNRNRIRSHHIPRRVK